MKAIKIIILLILVCIILLSIFAIQAEAAKKSSKLEYFIAVNVTYNRMYVYSKKPTQLFWKLCWVDKCSTGNPYWEMPEGLYRVKARKKSFKFDGEKYQYGICFGNSRMTISGPPKFKKGDDRKLGTACTMGPIWVSNSRAKWLYQHIPNGSNVYIVYNIVKVPT